MTIDLKDPSLIVVNTTLMDFQLPEPALPHDDQPETAVNSASENIITHERFPRKRKLRIAIVSGVFTYLTVEQSAAVPTD